MGSIKKDVDLFPSDLEFSIFSGEEIKKLSVAKIVTGLTFDSLGHALPGGLYDNRMGTYGRSVDQCATCCSLSYCPGHLGHIELFAKAYNPFFLKLIRDILKIFCLHCHKIQMKDHTLKILTLQFKLVESGFLNEAQELEIFKSEYICGNSDESIKTETGEFNHPFVAKMLELLAQEKKNSDITTKTTNAVRSALVHSALQNPTSKKCIHCNKHLKKIQYLYKKLVVYMTKADLKEDLQADKVQNSGNLKVFLADECQKHLREIYSKYSTFLHVLFPILKITSLNNEQPTDALFMDCIMVTPPKARPTNVLLDQIVEHPTTTIYRRIIENNNVLRVIMMNMKNESISSEEATIIYQSSRGETPHEKMYYAWQDLQTSVDNLLDTGGSRDMTGISGLKQILEKKDGLIRKHMMGKRVNYAARTVITPDPNINVEEVGMPDIFARRLSYPVPVTPWNVSQLRKMVMNGPNIHPGANFIEDEKGYTSLIPPDDAAKRESMAKLLLSYPENGIKIVHRHVVNGDVVLLNRQPSLHKPSIMAHTVRILPGEKTFRLHYSNCKAYNADFDGDEMNAHLPQNEVARSEAYNLVNVANNYLVPKDGSPLGGLIQDHVISGVKLSMRGRFFNREDYQQLVFQGLPDIRGNIELLPPAILKPAVLWSGKQILSTIIKNIIPKGYSAINLTSKAKIGPRHWEVKRKDSRRTNLEDNELCESEVIIRNGELLVGVLDKQQYGATQYGLIHCMYELYGGSISSKLLTALTKVFTFFLQREGFTLGIHDILVSSGADQKRHKIVEESRLIGNSIVASVLDLDEDTSAAVIAEKMESAYVHNPKFRVVLDRKYKSILDGYTNDINKVCLPGGLISKFPANNLQLMVLSGAKGSMVNTMQISCLLGQIELEGKRPPLMISGKSLPCFASFETSPKSGGFIDGRFMTGIQPQDFFFHCMAGREGLIDTAVKTSRSGYLQRCLIKHLEGLKVDYDLTVRDSDKSVVQFLYGEDGLDILKSTYFNEKCLKFLDENASIILRPKELEQIKDDEALTLVSKHTKKINTWRKKQSKKKQKNCKHKLYSGFTHFSAELRNQIEVRNPKEPNKKTGHLRLDENIVSLWMAADDESKTLYRQKYAKCPDPTVSQYSPDSFYGSVTENVQKLIESYVEKYPDRKEDITDIMYVKNMKSLANPGESVGLLAAQSIGEPSTQMTLNTFHFAGRGEMNVTLGIPRLREILMLASMNIKTPSMDIPIKPNQLKASEKLRINLNRVTLADVLEYVKVKSKMILEPRAHEYQIHFQFLPREAYDEDFCVRPKRIIKQMNTSFFKLLFRAIIRSSKKSNTMVEMENPTKSKSTKDSQNDADADDDVEREQSKQTEGNSNTQEDKDSSDDEEVNDDENDATGIRLKSRKVDETEYDEPDVDEEINDANEDDDVIIIERENSFDGPAEEDSVAIEQIENVLSNEMVTDYTYDRERHLWCKLTFNLPIKYKKPDMTSVIREIANKFVLHEVNKIKRAIMYKNKEELTLKTDGINIVEMFEHNNILDLNRLYSNDIHAIARTYGIEAAAKVIVTEVQNVFKVYGITVDPRHLSLIADYMTFDGSFKPLSRKGMEYSSSPLQQMSFESCMQFLKSAAVHGQKDELQSPSSRLIVGLPVENGTGCFDLLVKIFCNQK